MLIRGAYQKIVKIFLLMIFFFSGMSFFSSNAKMSRTNKDTNIDYNKNYVDKNIIEYDFVRNGKEKFTFKDFIDIPKNNDDSHQFEKAVSRALSESEKIFQSYYWECLPTKKDTTGDQFKFVTIKAPELAKASQDIVSFKEHFNKNRTKLVTSFRNLGKDAILVAPLPKTNKEFTHLAKFNENADGNTKRMLWEEVAAELGKELEDQKPRWLSTNGMGVSYLHVRIDIRPKYYQYEEYRTAPVLGTTTAETSAPAFTRRSQIQRILEGKL